MDGDDQSVEGPGIAAGLRSAVGKQPVGDAEDVDSTGQNPSLNLAGGSREVSACSRAVGPVRRNPAGARSLNPDHLPLQVIQTGTEPYRLAITQAQAAAQGNTG
ncbi:hypothetical protein OG241_32780 [Streptomyces sp. NBC_01390]|uniref:hypothetical protein n=1 Tax=Streptomyces sp. NBC_01390 TaxID=2903850 RepID=UPI0032472E5A